MKRISLLFLFLVSIISCGGGGGSNVSAPTTPLPAVDDEWDAKTPNYDGLRSEAVVSSSNASDIALTILAALDLVNALSFGNEQSEFLFLSQNSNVDISDEIVCESGSITYETSSNTRRETFFNECSSDNAIINGSIKIISDEVATLILDIVIVDVDDDSTIALEGNVRLFSANEFLYSLLMEINSQEVLFFDQFNLLAVNKAQEKGVVYNGDIYISTLGKLTVQTTHLDVPSTFQSELVLDLTGDVGIELRPELQKSVELLVEGYIPINISLTSDFLDNIPLINEAPKAVINGSSVSERNASVSLDYLGSNDPNLDLLSWEWRLLSQPLGSDIESDQESTFSFVPQIPGNYVISLTVTDPNGLTSTTQHQLKVQKNTPDIIFEGSETPIPRGTEFLGEVNVANDDLDGPFKFALRYGPEGMHLTESGQLSWFPSEPDFGDPLIINYGVQVTNSDHSVDYDNSFILNSEKVFPLMDLKTGSQLMENDAEQTLNVKGKEHLIEYAASQGYAVSHRLNADNQVESEILLIGFEQDVQSSIILHDVNLDSVIDLWYWKVGSDQSSYEVIWRNGKTGQETVFYSSLNKPELSLVDYEEDGEVDIVIYDGAVSQILATSSGDVLASFPYQAEFSGSKEDAFCDVNGDGFKDLLIGRGRNTTDILYDIKNQHLIEQNLFNGFADMNGDGICSVLSTTPMGEVIKNDYLNEHSSSTLFSISGFEDTFFVSNFDDKLGQDILFLDRRIGSSDAFYVYSQDSELKLVSRVITFDPSIDELILQLYVNFDRTAILDMNGDGVDEILFIKNSADSQKPNYLATANLLDTNIELTSNSLDSFYYRGYEKKIFSYQDSQLALTNSVNNYAFVEGEKDIRIELPEQHSLLYIDNSLGIVRALTYESGTERAVISLFDELSNVLWATDLPDNFNVDETGDHFPVQSANGTYIIPIFNAEREEHSFVIVDAEDGRTAHIGDITNTEKRKNTLVAKTQSGDAYLHISHNGKLIKIAEDSTVSYYSQSDLKSDYSVFANLDSDISVELLLFDTDNQEAGVTVYEIDSEKFQTIGTENSANLALPENYERYLSGLLGGCTKAKLLCKNLIWLSGSLVKSIDATTGEEIWTTSRFSAPVVDANFKSTENQSEVNYWIQLSSVGVFANH